MQASENLHNNGREQLQYKIGNDKLWLLSTP